MGQFAELAGSRIHYDDVGKGDVVLLVHGLGLDLRMWDDQVPALINAYSGCFFAQARAGLERKPKTPTAEALKDFALPALIVVGEHELPDFRDIADEIVKRLPGARKVVLPGVGHMCNMED